jgi:hypothetical protein
MMRKGVIMRLIKTLLLTGFIFLFVLILRRAVKMAVVLRDTSIKDDKKHNSGIMPIVPDIKVVPFNETLPALSAATKRAFDCIQKK